MGSKGRQPLGTGRVGAAGAKNRAFRNAFDDPSVVLVHVRAVEYGCFYYEVRRA